MPRGFSRVRYHAHDPAGRRGLESLEGLDEALALPPGLSAAGDSGAAADAAADEAAARHYLDGLFARSGLEAVQALRGGDQPEQLPNLRLESVQPQPLTGTRLVRFEQTHRGVPVYGSQVLVELDARRGFVSGDTVVAHVPANVSPIASLSPQRALAAIERYTRSAAGSLLPSAQPPQLFYYRNDSEAWHLAWYFAEVPAAPPPARDRGPARRRGPRVAGESAAEDVAPQAPTNYLVDAHDGAILHHFSALRSLAAVQCRGLDEDGVMQAFMGDATGQGYQLSDPDRRIATFDLCFSHWKLGLASLPAAPVTATSADWQDTARGHLGPRERRAGLRLLPGPSQADERRW